MVVLRSPKMSALSCSIDISSCHVSYRTVLIVYGNHFNLRQPSCTMVLTPAQDNTKRSCFMLRPPGKRTTIVVQGQLAWTPNRCNKVAICCT